MPFRVLYNVCASVTVTNVRATLVHKLYTALAGSAGAVAKRFALGLRQGICRTGKNVGLWNLN
jgi:hypothetical protein